MEHRETLMTQIQKTAYCTLPIIAQLRGIDRAKTV
jgi:hypothetical protein